MLPWSLNTFRARRAAAVQSETMAYQVARALNSLTGVDFTRSLSSRDQHDISHFIEDLFYSAPKDQVEKGEESGEHEYYTITMLKSEIYTTINTIHGRS